MRTAKWVAVLAGVMLVLSAFAPQAAAVDAVTGTIVQETQPAVWDEVTDPTTGETTSVLVTPPVYAPVMATVQAYGAGSGKGTPKLIASVTTNADGSFAISGLTANVYLKVVPASTDWQPGWLWVEYLSTDPLFASYVQRSAPAGYDVTPSMDLGMIQLQQAWASGRVVDATTGAPIAGATVRYDPVEIGRKAFQATTGANGEYRFTGLDYEEYYVHASARRYLAGYLGFDNLLYPTIGEGATFPMGRLPGDVIRMTHR